MLVIEKAIVHPIRKYRGGYSFIFETYVSGGTSLETKTRYTATHERLDQLKRCRNEAIDTANRINKQSKGE